ncbi:uncharacterized protein LOC141688985 isoform X2 [Apium graveolens]|uniref:uncharacterized protein LOC141688985 isoform X2 n=1 Tax=Apium graveolens TaxID=4045 RepID=UPI003D79F005
MDRYRKVQKTKAESVINENEIRITSQGFVRNYISYATSLLQENDGREIVLKAMGPAINKAVAITEIIKRRIPQLHQDTVISSVKIVDVYEPIEEGLLPVETSRNVSMVSITLSTKELNKNSPGYQAPAAAEQVKQQQSRTQHIYQQQQPPRQHNYQQRPRNNYQQQHTSRPQNNYQQEQPSKPQSNYQQQQPSRPQNNQQQQSSRPLNYYQQQLQSRPQNNNQQQSRRQDQQQPVARQAHQSYDVADEDMYGRGRGGYRGRGRGRGWSRGGNGNYEGNNRGNYQGEGDGARGGRRGRGYGRSHGRMGSYARDDSYQRE